MKAADVFAEVEVEYHLREIMDVVEETLVRMASFDRNPRMVLWQTPFYDIKVVIFVIDQVMFSFEVVFYCRFCLLVLWFVLFVEFEGIACFLR